MLLLAGPVALAELGWMAMGVVDTIMVGRLGATAIGAVGLGSSVFAVIGICAMGLLLGLDTLVAQAFGGRRLDECHVWLLHGLAIGAAVSVPVMAIGLVVPAFLAWFGVNTEVLALAAPYIRIVNLSVPPLLVYAAARRYLQSIGLVRPVMIALVSANLVNAVVNWILIFGHFGAPALGVRGAAWATTASRLYMAGFLIAAIVLHDRGEEGALCRLLRRVPWEIDRARVGRLFGLGLPAAGQIALEYGVFAVVTALAGRLAPTALAAHQVALNLSALTFMVSLGVASAGAVRVGQAVGRGDSDGVARAGWTALAIATLFMASAALVFLTAPRALVRVFTADAAVMELGVTLLALAAVFQLFDGLQVVATGILRGLGDTRTPMLWNAGGHWLLGLPVGYLLCFKARWGAAGLWVGLSIGLIFVGLVLLGVWHQRARHGPPGK